MHRNHLAAGLCTTLSIWLQGVGSREHISPQLWNHLIVSEESSIKVNKKLTVGFPTIHQRRSCVTP